jgi:hypothetical protein
MPLRLVGAPPGGRFRALSISLRIGALYDFVLAGLMLLAPELLQRAFALPLPGEAFYLRTMAVLLAMVAGVYLVAASDPAAYRPLVAIAIVGRLAGFLSLLPSALGEPRLAGAWGPALGDLAFAAVHAATARRLWR